MKRHWNLWEKHGYDWTTYGEYSLDLYAGFVVIKSRWESNVRIWIPSVSHHIIFLLG